MWSWSERYAGYRIVTQKKEAPPSLSCATRCWPLCVNDVDGFQTAARWGEGASKDPVPKSALALNIKPGLPRDDGHASCTMAQSREGFAALLPVQRSAQQSITAAQCRTPEKDFRLPPVKSDTQPSKSDLRHAIFDVNAPSKCIPPYAAPSLDEAPSQESTQQSFQFSLLL